MDTFVSTAVKPLTREATDKSLHEIDFILPPRPKNELPDSGIGQSTQLYWIGLVGTDGDSAEMAAFFQKDIFTINIGGESRYGFGCMKLHSMEAVDTQTLEALGGIKR